MNPPTLHDLANEGAKPTGYKIRCESGAFLATLLGYEGNTTSTEWTHDEGRALVLPVTKGTVKLARDLDAALQAVFS